MTTSSTIESSPSVPKTSSPQGAVLLCLPSMADEARQAALAVIAESLPEARLLVASPEHAASAPVDGERLSTIAYDGPRPQLGWVLAAGDYLAAAAVANHYRTPERQVAAIVLLGADSITPETLTGLVASVQRGADLAIPCLLTGPNEGLVAAALLYPLTRALYVADVRSPLPFNIALSPRALDRLLPVAQRLCGNGSGDALLWPVAEAAVAGLVVHQVKTADHNLAQPQDLDFNTLFASVAASLFTDIESKATFWQRSRSITALHPDAAAPVAAGITAGAEIEVSAEQRALVDGFHLAYANLQQIWSLVLPPQTLLALKKLSLAGPQQFTLAPSLWARIVYDFTLAFHLRTINRGHLLGAFTPLYLAWVASHLQAAGDEDARGTQHIERTAAAFETERPYLVARWRWPDRFNP